MLTEHLYLKGRGKNSSGNFTTKPQEEHGNDLIYSPEASACGPCCKKIKNGIKKECEIYGLESI